MLISTSFVESRPISWTGGSTIMYKSNSMMSSYYYHYSPSFKYSVGTEYINDRYHNEQYVNIRSTYLLDRKNTKESQRNLYMTASLSIKEMMNTIMEFMVIGRHEDTLHHFPYLINVVIRKTILKMNSKSV